MSSPLISVILPTYKRHLLLQRALASVAAQTFRDFEVVVVDDGSPDSDFKQGIVMDLPAVTLIRHEVNRGAAAARNSGIAAAKGDWISFLDSDDSWSPEKLAAQADYLRSTDRFLANCTGFRLHRGGHVSEICYDMAPGEFATQVLWGCRISPGSCLMTHRQVFNTVGPFDETFRRLEDWDWLLRFSQHYDMSFLQRPLVDVFVDDRPPATTLREDPALLAIDRIKSRHLPWIRARGWSATTKFQSTIRLEKAARLYWIRRPVRGVFQLCLALLWYPARNREFFWSLWSVLFRRTSR